MTFAVVRFFMRGYERSPESSRNPFPQQAEFHYSKESPTTVKRIPFRSIFIMPFQLFQKAQLATG
jgi:hypothetical protein